MPRPPSLARAALRLLPAAAAAVAAAAGVAEPPHQAPGTRRMAELLDRIVQESDPSLNVTLSDQRAALIRRELAAGPGRREGLDLTLRLAANC